MLVNVDKYKVASDLKKNNPKYRHKEVIEIANEAVKLMLDYPKLSIPEAVEKAKEVLNIDSERIQ